MTEEEVNNGEEIEVYAEAQQKSENFEENNRFLLKERFEIDFSQPISWLDNNSARAFAVTDRIDINRRLFALICSKETSPRLSLLPYLKSIDNSALMKLVEFGTVNYIPEKSRNMALIYAMPTGGKVFENGISTFDIKNNTEKFYRFVLSLTGIIDNFKTLGITHRAIRPDNLYYRNSDRSEIVLGDCAASFPAYHQPPICETIESLDANPEARGDGGDKDDIYATGVTALCLAIGHEVLQGVSAPEMLRLKLRRGSYSLLSGDEKINNTFVSLLKGLLQDDPELRWNRSQIISSSEGKPIGYNQQTASPRPKRSLTISGEKVFMPNDIVYMLQSNIDEAYELISAGKITDWVKNGMEDEKLSMRIDSIVKQERSGSIGKDTAVAKVCILLSPRMPIKYRDITFFPGGIAKAVFLAMKNHQPLKNFIDIFSSDLVKMWYQEQDNLRSPGSTTEFRVYIMRQEIGYGIERIIYDIDNDLPCISPLFGDDYVSSAPQVLKALDKASKDADITVPPYDRILIAYLRCKMGKKIDNIISDLNSVQEEIRASAILHLYTSMQNKFGPAQLPELAKRLINFVKPVIHVYHNRKYQRYLEKELLKVYKSGKLYEIVELLENETALEKDRVDYAGALNEANILKNEIYKITNNTAKFEKEAYDTAVKFASICAVLIMAASFAYNLITWVLK